MLKSAWGKRRGQEERFYIPNPMPVSITKVCFLKIVNTGVPEFVAVANSMENTKGN